MRSSYHPLCFLLSYTFIWTSAFALVQKTYEIHDLESSNETLFAQDVSKWTVQNNLTNKLYTSCGGTFLLGGDGVLGPSAWFKRTYDDLPTHTGIMGEITFWFIDDWKGQDILMLVVSSESQQSYYGRIMGLDYNSAWGSSTCGNPSIMDLKPVKYYFIFNHSGKNLTIQIINKNFRSQDRAFYGIRDIKILIVPTIGTRPTVSCGASNFLNSAVYKCDCLTNQYLVSPGSCIGCDSSCAHCSGSGPNNCIVCPDNRVFDGTSCQSCHSNCETCLGLSENQCLTCRSGSSRYLYKNSTCLLTCNLPFTVRVENGISYCDFPCNTSSFLYPNSSCLPTCSFPFQQRAMGGDKFCDVACSPTFYSYPDNTCQSFCNHPMQKIYDIHVTYCVPPCSSSQYYDPKQSACVSQCLYRDKVIYEAFYNKCGYLDNWSMAILEGTVSEVVNKGLLAASLLLVGHSWGISVAVQARMFQYIRYLDLFFDTYSGIMNATWNSSIYTLQFGPPMPPEMQLEAPLKPIPSVFSIYKVHSNFLVNFWQGFLAIIIIILVFLVLRILEFFSARSKKESLLTRILYFSKVAAQNASLIMLYGNYGDAILLSVIMYQALEFDSTFGILGFILSLVFILATLLTIFLHCWILFKRKKLVDYYDRTEKEEDLIAFSKSYEGFKVLFADFKPKSQIFLLLFIMRDLLVNIVLGTFYEYPFHQASFLTILSTAMTVYLFSTRPYKEFTDQFQQFFCEVLLLLSNLASLVVAVMDDTNNSEKGVREYIGKSMIMMHIIFDYSIFGFFGLKVFMIFYNIYRARHPNKMIEKRSKSMAHRSTLLNPDLRNQSSVIMRLETQPRINLDGLDVEYTDPKDGDMTQTEKTIKTTVQDEASDDIRKEEIAKEVIKALKRKLDMETLKNSGKLRVHVGQLEKGESFVYKSDKAQSKKEQGFAALLFNQIAGLKGKGKKKSKGQKPKDLIEPSSNTQPGANATQGNKNTSATPDPLMVELRCKEREDIIERTQEYGDGPLEVLNYTSSNQPVPRGVVFQPKK